MDNPEDDLDTNEILSDLGFDVGPSAPRTVGRPRKVLRTEYIRDLTEADLAAMAELPRASAKVPALKRIHASHHALARCLASGMKPFEASLVTGYSAPRISTLQNDEAFAALVAAYAADAKLAHADLAERMSGMSLDAIEVLQSRLHDNPEAFSIAMLVEVVKSFADRTGFGPDQKSSVNLTVGTIDRPPRETFDEWQRRRNTELGHGPTARSDEALAPALLELKPTGKLN